MERKVLGKGINALIPGSIKKEDAGAVNIAVKSIRPNTNQPRSDFDEHRLDELVASIKEKGFIQPVVVRKSADGFELIAGERRLRAAKKLSLETIPAVVKDISDRASLELALIENIQRDDLSPLEEANAYRILVDKFQLKQEEISKTVGKSRPYISNMLRLLKLPKEVKQAIGKGQITYGHGKALLEIENIDEQIKLLKQIIAMSLSVRELEGIVYQKRKPKQTDIKRKNIQNPEIILVQEKLQRYLGTKVRISSGRKRGEIKIEYYSLNDLQRVVNLISNR
ncbi:MAG: ParB/RepB/Spo0J family partition protein [Candidatus Gygaella obscura]|nr:ParB/RepB/Spo0J family partition protein [Candidatus Gygaella obscura]